MADRFGEPGLRALRMARGIEGPLRPRDRPRPLAERLELPEGCSGGQLARALALLCDRLLANRGRGGRTLRRLRLGARLAGGGGWSTEVALREASADRERLRLALAPSSASCPAPPSPSRCGRWSSARPPADQRALERSPDERRRERIAEAVRQARAAAGRDAVLRVLEVEPDSRVPERRAIFTPYPGMSGKRIVYWPAPVAVVVGRGWGPGQRRRRQPWRRCGRTGWSRTAGGRRSRCSRRYFELVLADGRCVVVFREPAEDGRWFEQRA